MAIYKINTSLPLKTQIELLNNMILELNGLISQSTFNKNEIDNIWDEIGSGYTRTFTRNIKLGNTLATYTGWSHLQAESGYSIWKYTPTTYIYNALNQLYFDNQLCVNKGLALSESATTFNTVFYYNGDSGTGYTDYTTEAGTETGTQFELMDSTTDYLYVGLSTTFAGIKFEFQTKGSNHTLKVEYYNGAWTELTANLNDLDDDTSNFESDGSISWTIPGDWTTATVNSISKYWIRVSTTTTPVATSQAYYIIPANNVISLLSLSSSQIMNEEWVWCSYDGNIYVTIRNTGVAAYEGDFYITSSSSVNNKQNFFIYNHSFSADYATS
jgi:hypothetical protein